MSSRRAKGEGTIYKRQDGRFEGSFSTGSGENRHRKTFYGNTRKEVADKLRAYAAAISPASMASELKSISQSGSRTTNRIGRLKPSIPTKLGSKNTSCRIWEAARSRS